jgi:hypothetical protein
MRIVIAFLGLFFFAACVDPPPPPAVSTGVAELRPESEGPAPRERGRAILADGSTVISRPGDEPGETELWYRPANGGEARLLFPAPGADDRPTALPDGRLLFVSTRTTIASLWIGDPKTGELIQLTNRGLAAGKPRVSFTPPPDGELMLREDGTVEYDAGGGQMISVALNGGAR